MKKIILLFSISFFLFKCSYSQTPDWVWAKVSHSTVAATNLSEGLCIATDNADNVYITGSYSGTITFGSFSITDSVGAFLAKYDGNGNAMWAKSSSGGQAIGFSVVTDDVGNIYEAGYFKYTVAFGSYMVSSVGDYDVFVVKYDPAGNVLWVKSGGGAGTDWCYAITTDHSNNLYITGANGSGLFTMGSDTLTSKDIFIFKLDSSGNNIWAKAVAGYVGYGLTTDLSNNLYLAGDSNSHALLAKYDSLGNQLWYKTATAGLAYSVTTDAFNNAYITGGYISPSILFGSKTLADAGGYDAFFVKYDSSGNVLWAKNIGGTGREFGYDLITDKNKNIIYLSGGYTSATLTFDTITVSAFPGVHDPMFLAGYDTSGHIISVKTLESGGDDWNSIALSGSCIYLGGDFYIGPVVVGNDTLVSGNGVENAFVAKLCYDNFSAVFSSSDTTICNESCIAFYDHSTGSPAAWQWSFPGALPSSSSLQNPSTVCYIDTGYHDVTLIVSGGGASDTVKLANFIYVKAVPPVPVITQSHDTLFCSTNPSYINYQWYLDSTITIGATDTFLIVTQSGNYNISVTNNNDCSIAVGINIVGIKEFSQSNYISLSPNPAENELRIKSGESGIEYIWIYNALGKEIYSQLQTSNFKPETIIDVSSLSTSIYFVQVIAEHGRWMGKFVKE